MVEMEGTPLRTARLGIQSNIKQVNVTQNELIGKGESRTLKLQILH